MVILGIFVGIAFVKLTSVRIELSEVPNRTTGKAIIIGKDRNGKSITTHFRIGTGTGGSVRGIILDHGRMGLARLHILNRTNILIGFSIKNGGVVMDEELADHLFSRLPARLQKQSQSDNVAIVSTHADQIKLNFVTRDERDGVKAIFRLKKLKWTFVSAKYWQYPWWNGKRNF